MIPDLAQRTSAEGARVILECEPRLVALFARSFPSVDIRAWDLESRGGVICTHYGWLKSAGGANAAIEMGTLSRFLRNDIENFPVENAYLRVDAEEADRWRKVFEGFPRPLIGVCWRSGQTGDTARFSMRPWRLGGTFIHALPGTVISMQYDAEKGEVAALGAIGRSHGRAAGQYRSKKRIGSCGGDVFDDGCGCNGADGGILAFRGNRCRNLQDFV